MSKFISTILILLALSASVYASQDYCYALALEGGGDKGAYQAGALSQIVADSDPSEVQYDVISGVSIGSINGAFMAGFPKGEEPTAVEEMMTLWKDLKPENIYKNWPWGGPVRGFVSEKALYDSSPFRKFIRTKINPPQRGLVISATNAGTGALKTWNEETEFETLLRGVDASSSYPGFFEPITDIDEGVTYYDGGTSFSVNIFDAINRCVDYGYKYDQIVVDVILCSGATLDDAETKDYKTLPMLLRYLEIERYFNTMELLRRSLQDFDGVNFRYVVAPTKKLEPGLIPMNFNHKQIMKMIETGKDDAKKAMQLGHGKNLEHLLEYHDQKVEGQYEGDFSTFLKSKNA